MSMLGLNKEVNALWIMRAGFPSDRETQDTCEKNEKGGMNSVVLYWN